MQNLKKKYIKLKIGILPTRDAFCNVSSEKRGYMFYVLKSGLVSVIDFLNSNAGVITTIATVVLAGLTRQYVKLTREIQKENDKPKVVVFLSHIYLSYEVATLELCVQNAGTGFAYDVKFAGDLSIYPNISHQPLAEYQIIKNGISHLAPGKVYHIPLFWEYEQSNLPQETLGIVVSYNVNLINSWFVGFRYIYFLERFIANHNSLYQ